MQAATVCNGDAHDSQQQASGRRGGGGLAETREPHEAGRGASLTAARRQKMRRALTASAIAAISPMLPTTHDLWLSSRCATRSQLAAHATTVGRPSWSQNAPNLWCHGTRYVRHTRESYAYGIRTVAQQLPCASGTHATQEAGTRSLYVQCGGSGTYGSA